MEKVKKLFNSSIFENLKNRTVLILGTGEMSQLLVSHLKMEGLSNIFVSSRDVKNAITFGDRNSCKPVILDNIDQYLPEVDIVFIDWFTKFLNYKRTHGRNITIKERAKYFLY